MIGVSRCGTAAAVQELLNNIQCLTLNFDVATLVK